MVIFKQNYFFTENFYTNFWPLKFDKEGKYIRKKKVEIIKGKTLHDFFFFNLNLNSFIFSSLLYKYIKIKDSIISSQSQ